MNTLPCVSAKTNKTFDWLNRDSPSGCHDIEHFNSYPASIHYYFNSRGFRDTEWPSDLFNLIWCIGDSWTMGLGCETSWPAELQKLVNTRCINVSMLGASCKWVARQAGMVLKLNPRAVIIQWPYIWKDEVADPSLSDEDRRINPSFESFEYLYNLYEQSVQKVENAKQRSHVIHTFVPGFTNLAHNPRSTYSPDTNWEAMPESAGDAWKKFHDQYIKTNMLHPVRNLIYLEDLPVSSKARDGYHYASQDVATLAMSLSTLLRINDQNYLSNKS
jgi:hypothetical protein